jgi:hypothetical protein
MPCYFAVLTLFAESNAALDNRGVEIFFFKLSVVVAVAVAALQYWGFPLLERLSLFFWRSAHAWLKKTRMEALAARDKRVQEMVRDARLQVMWAILALYAVGWAILFLVLGVMFNLMAFATLLSPVGSPPASVALGPVYYACLIAFVYSFRKVVFFVTIARTIMSDVATASEKEHELAIRAIPPVAWNACFIVGSWLSYPERSMEQDPFKFRSSEA